MNPRFLLFPLFLAFVFALAFGPAGAVSAGEDALPDGMVVVSTGTSPLVAYKVERQDGKLTLSVHTARFEGSKAAVTVEMGFSGDKTQTISISDAGDLLNFSITMPLEKIGKGEEALKKLRVAFAVEWAGGAAGQPRLRERFLHRGTGATHAGLSNDPADWEPLDLEEYERAAADRARQITLDFTQPMEGKATVVLENEKGERVRNLISGQIMAQGPQRLVWDGLDEGGNVAAPGNYRWRAISHPGLTPKHLMDFCDAPGSNHATFQAAVKAGDALFFAAPVTEGGFEIVELAPDGKFARGFNPPHGHGMNRVALAADTRYLYVAHDGMAWGEHVDRSKADWKETRMLSVMRVDRAKNQVEEWPDKTRFSVVRRYKMGPGSSSKMPVEDNALAGLALVGGKLYLADREAGVVMVIDPATGQSERTFALADATALASSGEALYAAAEGKLVKLDAASGKGTILAALEGKPAGLALGPDGEFYVSDGTAQVVRVLDGKGKPVRAIGKPGGIAPGAYDALKLKNPAGLLISDGLVWVTERDRWQPKRLAAFDLKTGEARKEYYGPTNYGAQGAGFDPLDQTRWIGQGALFQLDFASKTAQPLALLGGRSEQRDAGRRHTFWRQDGRTLIITSGKATWIQELKADGTMRPLACLSSGHQFSYENDWRPPQVFIEAFNRDYPKVPYAGGKGGKQEEGKPGHGYGMLWVDRNGDAEMQADEIEFATAASSLAGSGWSHDFHDLTLRVPGEVGGKKVLVTLKPDGWWPGGAPRYPALNDAARAGTAIDLPESSMVESITDRFGNTVLNSDPAMRAVSAEGKLLWTYPNRWSGVHGSHDAPLPTPGELQGALFYSGMAPLDEKADVMLINGNHGRAFVMTSDGLYLDEMFPDVRLMTNPQANGVGILGGECFGGTFGKSEKDGNYYFQGGGISYRVYRVDGLREVKRSEGSVAVSAEQSIAAARNQTRRAGEQAEARETTVAWRDKPPVIDGKDDDWSEAKPAAQWKKQDKFPVTVRAARDANMLYLHYQVEAQSPWVNNGKDWQALFKTGDGVDFQIGTDAAANLKRTGPVPGDLRLFIAPMGQENVAVLYRHRLPGAAKGEEVVFQSPWRSEKVDSVRRLTTAQVAVERKGNGYQVEVVVPLAELGLSADAVKLRGDFGVLYGDSEGTATVFRNYWSNHATGLVNDVPGEIMLSPNLWGGITFGPVSK